MPNEPRDHAHEALKQAHRAAKQGDVTKVERWTRAAERLAVAAERVAALPEPAAESDEAMRAELRRRLQRYAIADQSLQRWEAERDLYEAALYAALSNGAEPPPPLSPHPFGADSEEVVLTNILIGPEPNDGLKA